jgi:hypothetical protein
MAHNSAVAVVAIFTTRAQAEGAIDELWYAGFAKNQIGLASHEQSLHQGTTATEGLEEKAADGAVAGAVTGTALGALAGAVAVAVIPGIGQIFSAGLLLSIATGAAAGAALGGFAGPFLAMGLSKEIVRQYEADFRAGRSIVLVQTNRPEEALAILSSHGPHYVEIAGRRPLMHTV